MFGYGIYKKKDVEETMISLAIQAKEAIDIATEHVENSRRMIYILKDVLTLPEYQDEKCRAVVMEICNRYLDNLTHEEYVSKKEEHIASIKALTEYSEEAE